MSESPADIQAMVAQAVQEALGNQAKVDESKVSLAKLVEGKKQAEKEYKALLRSAAGNKKPAPKQKPKVAHGHCFNGKTCMNDGCKCGCPKCNSNLSEEERAYRVLKLEKEAVQRERNQLRDACVALLQRMQTGDKKAVDRTIQVISGIVHPKPPEEEGVQSFGSIMKS